MHVVVLSCSLVATALTISFAVHSHTSFAVVLPKVLLQAIQRNVWLLACTPQDLHLTITGCHLLLPVGSFTSTGLVLQQISFFEPTKSGQRKTYAPFIQVVSSCFVLRKCCVNSVGGFILAFLFAPADDISIFALSLPAVYLLLVMQMFPSPVCCFPFLGQPHFPSNQKYIAL